MADYKLIPSRALQFVKRYKILVVMTVVLMAGGGFAVWRLAGNKGDQGYITEKVAYGDIVETIGASGVVEPVQDVVLTFKNQGYVEINNVHVGDRVKAGQVLAVQQSVELQAQLDQAEAGLQSARTNYDKLVSTQELRVAQARAELEQAKSNLDSTKAALEGDKVLLENGVISQAELDAANNSYQAALSQYMAAQINFEQVNTSADIEAAAAQVKSAQAQVTVARNNLNNSRIIAPFDGYIAQITGDAGQWSGSGSSSEGTATTSSSSSSSSSQFSIELCSIGLRLKAEINEADISKVKVGQEATFTVDTYPDKTFTGKLTSLAPRATTINNVQMYDAIIDIDDYCLLKAGLPANINIIIASAKNVLVIPQSALDFARTHAVQMMRQNKDAQGDAKSTDRRSAAQDGREGTSGQLPEGSPVLVLQNGKPSVRMVETGLSDDVNVEVKSGLKPGDQIILEQTGAAGDSPANKANKGGTGSPGSSTTPSSGGGFPSGMDGALRGPAGTGRPPGM